MKMPPVMLERASIVCSVMGGLIGAWVGMWSMDCLSGMGGEVGEELSRRMIDVCCLQVDGVNGVLVCQVSWDRGISCGGLKKRGKEEGDTRNSRKLDNVTLC